MRKKIIAGLLIMALITISVTFGYMVNQVKTNSVNIVIGGAGDEATLTYTGNSNDILVPNYITQLSSNEVTRMVFTLKVESDTLRNYRLDTELPPEYQIETDRTGQYYTTGVTYTIVLTLLEEVEYTSYDFYLYVNFM